MFSYMFTVSDFGVITFFLGQLIESIFFIFGKGCSTVFHCFILDEHKNSIFGYGYYLCHHVK